MGSLPSTIYDDVKIASMKFVAFRFLGFAAIPFTGCVKAMNESPDLHECWNASVGRTDMQLSSLFMGPLFGFDAMVFRLATGTARLKK